MGSTGAGTTVPRLCDTEPELDGNGTMSQSSSWTGSTALVTGATGMVGSWLVRELLARGTRVVALIHDADPQSELFRSGDATRVSVVNGALEDPGAVERAINEHDVDTVFHLGAQTIVGRAVRSPLPTFEGQRARQLLFAGRVPPTSSARQTDRLRLVGQGLW